MGSQTVGLLECPYTGFTYRVLFKGFELCVSSLKFGSPVLCQGVTLRDVLRMARV